MAKQRAIANTREAAITLMSGAADETMPASCSTLVTLFGRRRGADRVARCVRPACPQRSVHDLGGRSVAASLFVWGAAPDTAWDWGGTPPWRVAQACVNSAPKNMIRAE